MNKKPKGIMTAMVLSFIGNAEEKGRTFGEIQRYVVEELHDLDYDEFERTWRWDNVRQRAIKDGARVRKHRGWWTCNLCGCGKSGYGERRIGILEKYCDKVGKRYILKG